MTATRVVTVALGLVALCALGPAQVGAQAAEESYFMDEAARAMPARRSARPSDGNAQGALGSQEMRQANSVASQLVRRRMRTSRPEDLSILESAREAEVIVLRGSYDRVQDVLVALEVDHVVIPPRLLGRLPLMSTQTLMVNCPGNMSAAGVEKITRFVETGGTLVTTDWALRLAARAFPETIRRGGRNTRDDVVSVDIVHDDHPYLENVQATDDTLRWWLEGASYPIHVIDPRRVEVLLESEQMRRRYGRSAVAVTFGAGEGRVLHTTSHFYLQQSRLESARDRARGSAFARDLGLGEGDLRELEAQGLDNVRVGQVAGAFAMQQLISNIVVTKRRENVPLLARFTRRSVADGQLRAARDGDSEVLGDIKSGFMLRELETDGRFVRVRDLFGREGWVEAALLDTPVPEAAPAPAAAAVPTTTTAAARDAAPTPMEPLSTAAAAQVASSASEEGIFGCAIAPFSGEAIAPWTLVFVGFVLVARRRKTNV